uniref:Uncharacterized protein n=1 Tax=Anguilla anguilla TaxID=7936 RepID=A0A0E9PRQ4_ANGAN
MLDIGKWPMGEGVILPS